MSRTEFSKKVRRDAFLRADGHCEGAGCGCKLTIGKFQYDHRIPDWMGGEPVLSNCQVLCSDCHKAKTAQDAADRGKAQRREDRHRGIRDVPRQRLQNRGFDKAPPQRRASTPLAKPPVPRRRSLYGEA